MASQSQSPRVSIASVVGVASDMRWGQVLSTPHAYAIVEVFSRDAIARVKGIQLLTKLTRLFLTPPLSLSKLSVIANSMMGDDVVSLLLLVPVGTTLYISVRGNGSVFLKRSNKMATLIRASGDLSGTIMAGDTVIAGSESFAKAFLSNEMQNVFDHAKPQSIAEKLNLMLHAHRAGEGASALIFQIEEETPHEDSLPIQMPVREPILTRLKILMRRIVPRHISLRTLLAFGVIGLFVVSVALGLRREYIAKQQSALSEVIRHATFSYEEGVALMDLNPLKGRERLVAARDMLAPVLAQKGSSNEAKQVKKLYDDVLSHLTRALRINQVTPELFFDVSLIKPGASISDLSLFDNALGAIDTRGVTAFRLSLSPKSGVIVGGGVPLNGMSQAAIYGDALFVLTPSGIRIINTVDQKISPHSIPSSPEWGALSDIVLFGGNIYIVDTGKSRIWKYITTKDGLSASNQQYSQLYEYLNPDTLPDLTKTTNMAIDGSVWLGTTVGEVIRFTAGKTNSISLRGTDTPLGKNLLVYTDADTALLYVLDSENHRIVVFDKDGMYIAQYIWQNDFAPTGFVVHEKLQRILLLRDGKIYTIGLK